MSRAISALRLTPVMFDWGPGRTPTRASSTSQRCVYRLYWQRYGQRVPGLQVSGLEEEEFGVPVLYVRRQRPIASPAWLLCWPASGGCLGLLPPFRTPAELGGWCG